MNLEQLAELLGPAFSASKIKTDFYNGMFKFGRDYIDSSNGTTPRAVFKASRVRKVYETPREKRKTYPLWGK